LAAAQDTARRQAEAKAEIASRSHPDAVVIAADTIVVAGDRFLGKPHDGGEAREMLRLLSGQRHHVVTGIAVVHGRKNLRLEDSAVTAVWFRELEDDEIARYVETREPLDKAGAYGIQGKAAVFVERLDGDYFNVVGLPLVKLAGLLERAGVRI
jgi:septum formation protein